MNVIKDLSAEVPDTNGFYFRLGELSDPTSKDNLYNGYNSIHNNFTDGERQVILNIWMPTEFAQVRDHFGNNALQYMEGATEVYGVCPFTTKWLDTVDSTRKYRYIFYPLNKKDIPLGPFHPVKEYDVCYFGGLHSKLHTECIGMLTNYNYRYMSMTHGINHTTQQHLPLATDLDLTHQQKIHKVRECKISVCYNIVPADQTH